MNRRFGLLYFIVNNSLQVALDVLRIHSLLLQKCVDRILVNIIVRRSTIVKPVDACKMRSIKIEYSRSQIFFRVADLALSRHGQREKTANPPSFNKRCLFLYASWYTEAWVLWYLNCSQVYKLRRFK